LAFPTLSLQIWDPISTHISSGISTNAAPFEVKYVSFARPRANGQVEHANSLILDGLKKRLHNANSKKGGKWINEIPSVVWGLLTQPSKATG
jgi:hypothetical protein